jgi:hypothetical protein
MIHAQAISSHQGTTTYCICHHNNVPIKPFYHVPEARNRENTMRNSTILLVVWIDSELKNVTYCGWMNVASTCTARGEEEETAREEEEGT